MTTAWIWMADADAVDDAALLRYREWLSDGELARYQRFARAQRLRQFVVGRVLLRMALGRLLDVAPQDVVLAEQVGKAPLLVAPVVDGAGPGFSISHSGRWVACSVSAQTPLGLDIEVVDAGRDLAALAAQTFDAREIAQWRGLPEARRVDGFYRLWSEKEARFKLGLPINPHGGMLGSDPKGSDPDLSGWQSVQSPSGGYCVALPHEELAVVLCSERRLDTAPQIEIVTLP